MTFTPGPDNVEKVIWSRNPQGTSSREFELPCSGPALMNRNGIRDDAPPFTCGTYARRSVIKYFLRDAYGGTKDNQGAKNAVIQKVRALFNATREAWSFEGNFMCTCSNNSATGWECCMEQKNCATIPCPCPQGYQVKMSVACCTSVCGGLAGAGLMMPFSYIQGSQLASSLLDSMGTYLQNEIWTSNDPWLAFDPLGAEAYASSWNQSRFDVIDAGLFDASQPVVYYDEAMYPFQATFWEHCTGLLQQVIWTLPLDRSTGQPQGIRAAYDPINGQSQTPNLTYVEDFIQSVTASAYKSSPVYWHYNIRHTPSQSEVCKRSTPRQPPSNQTFQVSGNAAKQFGFSSMTLGGLGGADCYCGWWNSGTTCKIPDALCASLVQILGFTRICINQKQVYNSSDHMTVMASIQTLMLQQPSTRYACPSLQISDHWGFFDPTTAQPVSNATALVLTEGVTGFRVGNANWLFSTQAQIINPSTRIIVPETPSINVALQCNETASPSIADLFIDDLFPSAQGVRQSMPESYCIRYGIELARLTVYNEAGLTDASGQQLGVVATWKKRCQYKLEELAVCNAFNIYNATGGQTDVSQCPFGLSVIESLRSSYAVTPGCLIVLWNTPGGKQDGIYDPCICASCANTPNLDIPAQLTSVCRLESFQQLVGDDVIPGESNTGVPLGSGSFQALMEKPGLLQVNTPDITHWALHTSIRDADLIRDWWPDDWKFPVGYHVTPGCSRPKDAHWKTFDASWRWDSNSEQMVFARDEVNDPLLSRNAFGSSGVCRTSNYGMPLTMLNSMAVCTKENANARADPMVPQTTSPIEWVDGSVNCAPGASSTPWDVDRTLNPPRQWTVGTLMQPMDILSPLSATEWGSACGPYPLKTCSASSDCATGMTCINSAITANGVCGKIEQGNFECTAHSQCGSDLMCAGDGVCVEGVWQIRNELSEPVSFRTYSQTCETGTALDTWGTSIAETLPDILNASGLCSYRSWFENRRMASRNRCNSTNVCEGFSGSEPWNFSAPDRQTEGESAFDSGVLMLQAHPCDRDYQFYNGFVSCTPGEEFMAMFDKHGNPIDSQFAFDNRSITYRVGKRLPLVHHMNEMKGQTYGFTGIQKTYKDLYLGTNTPAIVPCAEQKVCSLQSKFLVNNIEVDQRLVITPMGESRPYTVQDLVSCGVFGFEYDNICQLDFAVVPLAWYTLNGNPIKSSSFKLATASLKASYTPDDKTAMLAVLSQLPDLFLDGFIGGQPVDFQDYLSKSAIFEQLYSTLSQINVKPIYSGAGQPNQLYYLTTYGAYEVPFAWWYKCAWLAGPIEMGMQPVDESICPWQYTGNGSQPTGFGSADPRIAILLGMPTQPVQSYQNVTLIEALISLPGILTPEMITQAASDYSATRNSVMQSVGVLLQKIQRRCYTQKNYIQAYSVESQAYQLARMNQYYDGTPFDLSKPYLNNVDEQVCNGLDCLTSTGYSIPTTSNADFAAMVESALKAMALNTNSLPLNIPVPRISGIVELYSLISASPIPQAFWDGLLVPFQNASLGCNTIVYYNTPKANTTCLCTTWAECSQAIQSQLLSNAKISATPSNTVPANIILSNPSNNVYAQVNACPNTGAALNADGSCFLNDGTLQAGLNFSNIAEVSVPVGITAELYVEKRWQCVKLTCESEDAQDNGKVVPASTGSPFSVTTAESIVIREFTFQQIMPVSKINPWPNLQTQESELECCYRASRFESATTNTHEHQNGQCEEQCSVEPRTVFPSYPYTMKMRTLDYYANNTLTASLEFYPCVETLQPYSDSQVMESLRNNDQYRGEYFTLMECAAGFYDTNNMSTPLSLSSQYLRVKNSTFFLSNGQTQQDVLDWLQIVISSANQAIVDPLCISSEGICTSSTHNISGSVSVKPWASSDVSNQCNIMAADPYFGCMMYPGESTEERYAGQWTDTYDCVPEINFFHLQYTTCMNSNNNPCQSEDTNLRDMQLSGRTIIYDVKTITPVCTTGPVSQCTMVNETSVLKTPPVAACPGTNTSLPRYNDYVNLVQYDMLYTNLLLPPFILSGESPSTASASGLKFDHIFLGLNPGYQCCSSGCTCQSNTQIPVELLENLYRCIDCPMVTSAQCTGLHNCRLSAANIPELNLNTLNGWFDLTQAQRSFLTGTSPGDDSTIDVVIPAVDWLTTQIANLWTSGIRLSYYATPFMTSFVGTYEYDPTPIIAFDAAMQINTQSCSTENGILPDFTNCSYDVHRRDLREFVEAYYKTDDGLIIEPQNTAQWRIGRAQMTSQNIPQWEMISATNRSGMFLSDLFEDFWCTKGSIVDNACYVHSNSDGSITIDVLNPGLLGNFEPSVGCDMTHIDGQRVIDAYCADCTQQSDYLTLEDGSQMNCPSTYTSTVSQITSNPTAASNLCSKKPSLPASCTNSHGMLSQTVYDGNPVSNLYTRQIWNGGQPASVTQNPLFQGRAPAVNGPSNLVLSPSDIGGHYVQMVIGITRSGAYTMSVQGLPLASYANALSSTAYSLVSNSPNMLWTQINQAYEVNQLRTTLYPNSVCGAWDCPLRRRAFYMGIDSVFRPSVPDPLRTQILFGSEAHPTQMATALPTLIAQTASRVLGIYSSRNGFCACMSPPCSGCPSDVGALYGEWTDSSVLSDGECIEQLDWPFTGGKLRDGSSYNQRWTTVTPCGIMDRLPIFRYMYTNLQQTQASSKTTLDPGGVCHTGWPVVTAGPQTNCYRIVESDNYMCPNFLLPKNVTRLRAKTVSELLSTPARPRLTDCNPPPAYSINGTKATAPEVSYGQLKRWEASRLLANDLRRRLCGNSSTCSPSSKWSLSTFWSDIYMSKFPPIPQGNGANDSLWSKPWVACAQASNGSQTCQGTIPRSDWVGGNRAKICLDTLNRQPLASNLSQNINVCDLDSSLDLFCRTVQDGRYRVFEANCLYSGQCRQQLYFYQPSTYEINNGEFVRDTVQDFYNGTVAGACVPDEDTAAAIQANAQALQKCAAVQLNVLVNCIQIVRTIVNSLVEIVYYTGELLLDVFELIGATNDQEKQQIIAQLNALLSLVWNKYIALFNEVGDLFYQILFKGPMGAWLIGMIQTVCNFLDWLFSDIVHLVLCWTQASLVFVLNHIASPIAGVLANIPFSGLGGLPGQVNDAVTSIQDNIPCSSKNLWSCNLAILNSNVTTVSLPMPTRCWAGVEPEVGGGLACTAADTCLQQSDYTYPICATCPKASSMTQFGCDPLTKLCTCNVFPVGISSCSSHADCQLDDSDVSCQYVDSYLQPSYGNVPCTQCPNPICLVTASNGVGQCSCLLRPVPSQTCSGVGQIVSPDAGDLCLVASASSGQSSSNAYSPDYGTLVSAPCMLLNQAQAYCMSVFMSGTTSTQLVVGLALLSTGGRRRLLWDELITNGSVSSKLKTNLSVWEGRSEPCRSLVTKPAEVHGILELYTRNECWRWYQIGLRLTIEANMTGIVSPFLLVSWKDLAYTMLDKQAMVEIFAKIPSVIHRLLMHSELTQPLYLMFAYWSTTRNPANKDKNLTDNALWTNDTVLDAMRVFMENLTSEGIPIQRRRLMSLGMAAQHTPERRKLLQSSDISTTISSQTAYDWSQGPYSWPPNFVYWSGNDSCALASTAIDVVKHGIDATILYYQQPMPQATPVIWPTLPVRNDTFSIPSICLSTNDFTDVGSAADTLKDILSNVTDAWLDHNQVRSFVTTAPYMAMLKNVLQCNFTRIQTCDDRHPIIWGAFQTVVLILCIWFIAHVVSIPYVEAVLALLFLPTFMYLTYGYSPTCTPLIPVCLFSDAYAALDWLLPASIEWPSPLVNRTGCASVTCLKSCTHDPIVGYSSFYDHIAWIMCESNQPWASQTAFSFLNVGDSIRTAVLRKCTVDTSDDMKAAQRICFSITLVNSLPLLLLPLLILWIVPSILMILSSIVSSVTNLAFVFVLFLHSHD